METEGGSQLLRLQKRGRVMQICVRDHVGERSLTIGGGRVGIISKVRAQKC